MSDLVQRTRQTQTQRRDIQSVIERAAPGLAAALADRIGVDRFVRAAVTTFRTTPRLANCTEDSILGALFIAAQLGLEVGGPRGHAYLVPYGKEATLIIGVRGWIELFYRTGVVAKVETVEVRDGDRFHRGSDSRTGGRWYQHEPLDEDHSRQLLGIVAQVVLRDGTVQWDYMTVDEILARRPSRWTGTPWETWTLEMYRKTVLRHLAKLVRTATDDLTLAQSSDETVQRQVEGIPDPIVEHLPVAGALPAPPRATERPATGDVEDVPPHEPSQPPTDDDEAWEAEERREYETWLTAQDTPVGGEKQ